MTRHRLSAYGGPFIFPNALYGALGSLETTSDLYTIDPYTAVATPIGPIGYAMTGLAFRPSDGVLFGVTSGNSASNPRSLVTIDPITGAGTLIGALGVGIADITFRSYDDALYGYSGSTATLYSINTTTGAATQVSATAVPGGIQGMGSSYDGTGTFYLFPKSASGGLYYIVDTNWGGLTPVHTLSGTPVSSPVAAATWSGHGSDLYISLLGSDTWLATVDTSTGVITGVGITTPSMDALAWEFVGPPPPAPPPPVVTVLVVQTVIAIASGIAPNRRSRSKWKLNAPVVVAPRPVVLRDIYVTLAPKGRRKTKPSVLRPPIVVTVTAAGLARDILVTLAPRARRKTKPSVLSPPIVVEAAAIPPRGLLVKHAPSHRISRRTMAGIRAPQFVLIPTWARDIVVVFAPQRRSTPQARSRLQPPVVLDVASAGQLVVRLAWRGRRR